MGCFCHRSLVPLKQALQHLTGPKADPVHMEKPPLAGENIVKGLAHWMGARGLPAKPWQPEPQWIGLRLPKLPAQLDVHGLATISAFVQLRASVLEKFGIDLLKPDQVTAFIRVAATMNERMKALAPLASKLDPAPWSKLDGLNSHVDEVRKALDEHVLAPHPDQLHAFQNPAGVPMKQWHPFLSSLKGLAPLIAVTHQLKLPLTEHLPAQLSTALRQLKGITLPPVPAEHMEVSARLIATMSSVGRLRHSLGIDPLERGYDATREKVAEKLRTTLQQLPKTLPIDRSAKDLEAEVLSHMPQIPYCPTNLAPKPAVTAGQSIDPKILENMNWQVPPITKFPALISGLHTCGLAESLQASLDTKPVLPAPCGGECDAARIMRLQAA